MLFCDLVGFTASSETADPEDVRARLRPYHARLREEIGRFGGTVEKFIGDAVMAVFGAPVAHEDDAERAVRAGLRILEAISELNESDSGFDLQVRVGINTGEAVVALGARPELGEAIVTGDVVNTASRIQGAAPVDAVAVSEQTHRATERAFDYEPLESVVVKGKAEPLALYRPLTARADLGREVTRSHTTVLVGRDLERSLLIGTFERATKQRSCQLVMLVGEPGVGKSRLCMELARHVDAQPGLFRWRQGRCLPYGDGIAFWALGEIAKAECGILESDSPETAEAKLERGLPDDDPDRAWLKSRLAPLVGVPAEPGSQEESFAAWRRVLESWAAGRETVLVFEDLHWADDSLLSFLEHLADWAEGVPLLVLCTARPELFERSPTFGANARNAQRINLSPLTDEETAQLIGSLLERTFLPDETQQTLLERAGGNPLYAEEFVRLLGDRGGEAAEVPESVQALIAARLDTLSPERKALLQDAAVVGKVFWTGALAEMGGLDRREVEVALHELARKELIRPFRTSSMDGESEYGFWHVLVRDVCYQQIPRAARGARHQAAAVWLEAEAGERIEDLADVLAHHYLQAFELARATDNAELASSLALTARRHLVLAGERSLGLDAAQAEALLKRARDLSGEDDPEWPELVRHWAEAASMLGKYAEIEPMAKRALEVCRSRGDRVLAGRLLGVLTGCSLELGRADYIRLGADAVALLEAEQSGRPLLVAYSGQAQLNLIDGNPEEALRLANKAYELAENLGIPPVRGLGPRGVARTVLGEVEGLADMERALTLAIDADLSRDAQFLLGHLAVIGYPIKGTVALSAFDRAIAFSRTRGFRRQEVFCETNRAGVLLDAGLPDEAVAVVAQVIPEVEASGDTRTLLELRGIESIVAAERGRSADALAHADWLADAVVSSRALNDCAWGHPAAAALAHLRAGQSKQAIETLQIVQQSSTIKQSYWYGIQLARMVRIALATGETDIARWLATDVPAPYDLNRNALITCEAALAEADCHLESAAQGYANAAQNWHEFGNVPERAYALLGQSRCLLALSHAGAEAPLTEARGLFASMGYKPALAVTVSLLEQATASR